MKKRLLFIDGPLGGGGAERVLIDILRNVDYDRFEVDLAVICHGGALMDEVPARVNVIELWPGYSLGYKLAYRLSKWLRCNWLFARKMNGRKIRCDYDLEISFLEGMPLKLGALRTTTAKKATWVHADLLNDPYEAAQFFKGEEELAYNKMDVVINVSKQAEECFRKRFPACKADMQVIYNPIDRAKIERMANEYAVTKKDGVVDVITVGRLTAQKNPQKLLDVAKLARDAGLPVRFKWVGDGPLRAQIEQMRDEMGLSDIVELTGFVKNPYPHIKAADIMLVTSDFEGFCLVVCEAQCLGVPVVSTPTAGPCEIIADNEYGILTDFDAHSMYGAVKALATDPVERRAVAARAKARPDEFAVSKTIKALERLITQ